MPMINIQSLCKEYPSGHSVIHALQNIDLTIEKGEFISFIGKSGSGKSTLLNLIGGLDRPTSGIISFNNQDLTGLSSPQLAEYRKTQVGIIFQSFNLIHTQTALENVTIALAIGGAARSKRKSLGMQFLEKVDLADRATHLPAELSGGESQRVAIARAIANGPEMVLADEPTGNLDTETSGQIIDLLLRLNKEEGKTILLITHDAETANRVSDRVVTLKDGKIISIK